MMTKKEKKLLEGLIYLSVIIGSVISFVIFTSYYWSKMMSNDISKQIDEYKKIYFSTEVERKLDKEKYEKFIHSWDIPRGFV